MSDKYILTEFSGIKTGFFFKDDKLDEIRCYEEDSMLGNIYVGRVSNIVKNINAAFIDIKKGLSCYYPLEEISDKPLKIGDLVTVQISKEPVKTKQPTVTTKISLTGKYVVVSTDEIIGVSNKIKLESNRNRLKDVFKKAINLYEGNKKCKDISFGGIIRTDAESVEESLVIEEILKLIAKLDEILMKAKHATAYSCVYKNISAYVADISRISGGTDNIRIITDIPDVVSECEIHKVLLPEIYKDDNLSLKSLYNLNTHMEKALKNRVYLKSGAYLIIEHTEAMTVVDVNSGKAIKGKCSEDDFLKINLEAAKELGRQLKIRNLSGIIIVDFINMKKDENNKTLMNTLKDIVFYDSVNTNVVDMTRLGLVEITRKKIRKPLHEVMKLNF